MGKLISKEEAIEALGARPISWTDSDYELGRQNQYDEDMTAILDISTIEAEPVRKAKWIEHKDYPGLAYLCSECSYFTTNRSYYCPYCGAKMDGSKVMATTNLTVPIIINWKERRTDE